ncbi:vesicle-associated protein 2-2-like isoform X3 [Prosopis cineraria]|uniref:vesicle-associated protein 2-2-like isoform X3 n=1 Tax=Prosopis cineraria TaxID=364024 RepID=UPI00240F3A73|nr:vesicle-associated protein 2-2-like isoform X3 [Prosopis cineraria]
MNNQLLEIEPKELKFLLTMQALKEAPADMACKDKFLIQSTIVPVGTTNEDITSSLFVKDDNKYVEENKLKVALISLTSSPELSPINGDFNNGLAYEKNQIFGTEEILSQEPMNVEHRMVNEESNDENDIELNVEEDERSKIMTDVEVLKPGTAELKVSKDVELNNVKDAQASNAEKVAMLNVSKSAEEIKLMEAIEEIKLKLDKLESKLNEAGVTISKLTEESRLSNLETKVMQEKIADLSKRGSQKIQVGFPLLYVCMVALISLLLGYRSHS